MKYPALIVSAVLLVLGTVGSAHSAIEGVLTRNGLSKIEQPSTHTVCNEARRGDKAYVLYRGSNFGWLRLKLVTGRAKGCVGWAQESYGFKETGTVSLPRIHSAGDWPRGTVPVFRTRDDFFREREFVKKNGWYRTGSVVCAADIGSEVEFKQYRDWGVGEAVAYDQGKDCFGWMAAGLVR